MKNKGNLYNFSNMSLKENTTNYNGRSGAHYRSQKYSFEDIAIISGDILDEHIVTYAHRKISTVCKKGKKVKM